MDSGPTGPDGLGRTDTLMGKEKGREGETRGRDGGRSYGERFRRLLLSAVGPLGESGLPSRVPISLKTDTIPVITIISGVLRLM